MSMHKYKVGQTVEFTPLRSGVPASARDYKIVRLQPPEDGNPTYRIKSSAEAFERIAKEVELKRR
jgi:hypothetical protein